MIFLDKNPFKLHPVLTAIFISSLILFACSSLRHALFQSNAYDLGIFDNGIYLISQGQEPFVSFRGLHILGDHAAYILYIIALFYKVYPDVHWLFAIQAFSLSLGALPTYQLSLQAGLKETQAQTLAFVYLLYPLIFNVNLFDFHPEVIALPAILYAVLFARSNKILGFIFTIFIILGCKEVLSLLLIAMGVWLFIFEKKTRYAIVSIILGLFWFFLSTEFIIPHFSQAPPIAVGVYSFLGNSLGEITLNIILKPGLVLSKIFTLANLEYLILLLIPLIWGLWGRHLTPLISATPILFLNLLAENLQMKNLTQQYSLAILPFLMLAVIENLAHGEGWFKQKKWIILWSLIAFFALAKYGYFTSKYLTTLDNWQATREALGYIKTKDNILTTDKIAPHLTHRPHLELAIQGREKLDLEPFQYVLLNQRHPGWPSSPELIIGLVKRLQNNPNFQLKYYRDEVLLFEKFSRE
ncbi:hypothetical protein PCC9214_02701 [Planktothrix tepida]|uniref:DUF2079 domain-containing protein n=1 Tax=Planktothrix tepida PCC 9214 TaxID=671072 RepID=A0A1J1LJG6_9CYAN|nr:DUF2079 domain-containing protein [Planktothrix tepida]CAD5953390.1 hypothetical protein PCC9214_02701 [Planktothrix tepida]CUR32749.1 conserved membrane hypothetical protein [Planktothrix tepida PCC 9214]